MYALIHDTFASPNGKVPLVRHIFVGRERWELEDALAAHLKTDAFTRECSERGNYGGKTMCNVKKTVVRVTPSQLEALQTQQLALPGAGKFGAPASCPPPSFWRFGAVTLVGSLASMGTRWAVKRVLARKQETTRNTASMVGTVAAFWLAAGIAWAVLARNQPDVRNDPPAA